jgi:hypothetical protein
MEIHGLYRPKRNVVEKKDKQFTSLFIIKDLTLKHDKYNLLITLSTVKADRHIHLKTALSLQQQQNMHQAIAFREKISGNINANENINLFSTYKTWTERC